MRVVGQAGHLDLLVALLAGDLGRLLMLEAAGADRVADTLRSVHHLAVAVLVWTLIRVAQLFVDVALAGVQLRLLCVLLRAAGYGHAVVTARVTVRL